MITHLKKINISLLNLLLLTTLFSCSITTGMKVDSVRSFDGNEYMILNEEKYQVVDITTNNVAEINRSNREYNYLIGPGDVITVTIWGQQDVFPFVQYTQASSPLISRTVNAEGKMFFPFVGEVNISGMSVAEARVFIVQKLAESFVDPQLDLTISKVNNTREIYLLGEFNRPKTLKLGTDPITLTNAIGAAFGFNPNTSDPNDLYIIRSVGEKRIYRVMMDSPASFLIAKELRLAPNDVVFVGPSDITVWNRFFRQLFPFTNLANQLDQINQD